ncbi:hypothetical protein F4814DRAFT_448594 [Daldinia grandis]|nr:hypothetical protein F4814DRAFT_448594 [Daldinia grandis]
MEPARGAIIRKEAKVIAADRREHKAKVRLVRRWIYDKYKPSTAGNNEEAQLDACDRETSAEGAAISTQPAKNTVWNLPASLNGRPGPKGLALGTMLQIAGRCYQISVNNFDSMGLCEHIRYIQKALQQGNSITPAHKALVTQPLIVLAQHQQYLAKKDFAACVAKIAVQSSLPGVIKKDIKTCKDCYDKFRPGIQSCACAQAKQTCLHGPCCYHPGKVKSWGVNCGNMDFLSKENVNIQEFNIWVHQCYWDCCGAKLLPVDPTTTRRSQKRKNTALRPWEITNDKDGSIIMTGSYAAIPLIVKVFIEEVRLRTHHNVSEGPLSIHTKLDKMQDNRVRGTPVLTLPTPKHIRRAQALDNRCRAV